MMPLKSQEKDLTEQAADNQAGQRITEDMKHSTFGPCLMEPNYHAAATRHVWELYCCCLVSAWTRKNNY